MRDRDLTVLPPSMDKDIPPINTTIAQRLKEVAQLLHSQGSNPFRVSAYQHAAGTLEQLERPIVDLFQTEGMEGLKKLPGVGESLARAIRELVLRGRLPMLERLRGETEPESLLATIPGIGKKLAARLHHDLEIDTLEELESAAHDGRLRQAGGIGEKRLAGIIACLSDRLGRARTKAHPVVQEIPSIKELLDVDREYREQAEAGALHLFAPRRFNPTHEAWLPVLLRTAGTGITPPCFPTPPGLIKKGKPVIGWCCFLTMKRRSPNARSLQPNGKS